jgi:hypothetical protein
MTPKRPEASVCGLMTAERPRRWRIFYTEEIVMFHGTYDRAVRADRYRKVAGEYAELSQATADPFLGSYYLRIAEDYQDQAQRELWALERESTTTLALGADLPNPEPQPNAS